MRKREVNKILQETGEIYNRIAPDFDVTRRKWWYILDKFKLGAKDGDRILDLGCGNGRMAQLFADSKINYLGIDNSEELIRIAREKFAGNKNITFRVGDITNLNLDVNDFDLVYVLAVLHHIPSGELRLKVLKDINKLMKSGGAIYISNWNIFGVPKQRKHLFNYKYKIFRGVWSVRDAFIPWKNAGEKGQRYIHSFTKREMTKLLQKAGFMVDDVFYENKGERSDALHGFNLVARARKK